LSVGGSYGAAADVAQDINAAEPELNAAPGSCPTDVSSSDPKDIVVDGDYTGSGGGANLMLCNDPTREVWVLSVAGHGRPVFSHGRTAASGGVSVGVVDPSPGDVSVAPGSAGTPPAGMTYVGPPFVVTDPEPPAGQAVTIVLTIAPGSLPTGGATAANLIVYRGGLPIGDCLSTSGSANPDPCVVSKVAGAGGRVTITVGSNGDSNATYTVTAPSAGGGGGGGCNGGLSGDTPNNVSGAPANDDFCHAHVLASTQSGQVTGTLASATAQDGDPNLSESDLIFGCCGFNDGGATASVWYVWTSPSSGVYHFDTVGSAEMSGSSGSGRRRRLLVVTDLTPRDRLLLERRPDQPPRCALQGHGIGELAPALRRLAPEVGVVGLLPRGRDRLLGRAQLLRQAERRDRAEQNGVRRQCSALGFPASELAQLAPLPWNVSRFLSKRTLSVARRLGSAK
jgi:hypothetical protein